jgi:hypothetical protein
MALRSAPDENHLIQASAGQGCQSTSATFHGGKSGGMEETETSITGKPARGTFAVSFFLAVLAGLEREGLRLEDL